jgi:Helix-turn-helix domain
MRASAKTRRIEKTEILIGRKRRRRFIVPKRHAQGVAQLLEEYEVPTDKEFLPAEAVFPELGDSRKRPGAVLRGFRLRDQMTQVVLAGRLGCPQPWISRMEGGARPIGKKMAERLSKVFNVDRRAFL